MTSSILIPEFFPYLYTGCLILILILPYCGLSQHLLLYLESLISVFGSYSPRDTSVLIVGAFDPYDLVVFLVSENCVCYGLVMFRSECQFTIRDVFVNYMRANNTKQIFLICSSSSIEIISD